jgi:RHS repeat-associated protein
VTDASGEVYQHIEYFAFGETFIEERSNPNEIIYKFNGKELDDETGLYYYGARYYDARISVWYGVDSEYELYPGWSPFNYVLNNPLNYIDPDGKAVYYNRRGREIGMDAAGKEDGKVTFVTDNREARTLKKQIKTAYKYGSRVGTIINRNLVKSGVTINRSTGEGVLKAIERVGKESYPGAKDAGLHEEGGHSENGNVVDWQPGSTRKIGQGASITPFNGVSEPSVTDLDTYWHVHTNKKLETQNADGQTITEVGSRDPSPGDYSYQRQKEKQGYKGFAIQAGINGQRINFYRGSGIFFNISIKSFQKAIED